MWFSCQQCPTKLQTMIVFLEIAACNFVFGGLQMQILLKKLKLVCIVACVLIFMIISLSPL